MIIFCRLWSWENFHIYWCIWLERFQPIMLDQIIILCSKPSKRIHRWGNYLAKKNVVPILPSLFVSTSALVKVMRGRKCTWHSMRKMDGLGEWAIEGGQHERSSVCLGGRADKRQLKDPPLSPMKKAEEHRSVGLLCTSSANPSPSMLAGQSAVGKVSLLKAKISSAVKQRMQLI